MTCQGCKNKGNQMPYHYGAQQRRRIGPMARPSGLWRGPGPGRPGHNPDVYGGGQPQQGQQGQQQGPVIGGGGFDKGTLGNLPYANSGSGGGTADGRPNFTPFNPNGRMQYGGWTWDKGQWTQGGGGGMGGQGTGGILGGTGPGGTGPGGMGTGGGGGMFNTGGGQFSDVPGGGFTGRRTTGGPNSAPNGFAGGMGTGGQMSPQMGLQGGYGPQNRSQGGGLAVSHQAPAKSAHKLNYMPGAAQAPGMTGAQRFIQNSQGAQGGYDYSGALSRPNENNAQMAARYNKARGLAVEAQRQRTANDPRLRLGGAQTQRGQGLNARTGTGAGFNDAGYPIREGTTGMGLGDQGRVRGPIQASLSPQQKRANRLAANAAVQRDQAAAERAAAAGLPAGQRMVNDGTTQGRLGLVGGAQRSSGGSGQAPVGRNQPMGTRLGTGQMNINSGNWGGTGSSFGNFLDTLRYQHQLQGRDRFTGAVPRGGDRQQGHAAGQGGAQRSQYGSVGDAYQRAYEDARRANEERYQDILAGRKDLGNRLENQQQANLNALMGGFGELGGQAGQNMQNLLDNYNTQRERTMGGAMERRDREFQGFQNLNDAMMGLNAEGRQQLLGGYDDRTSRNLDQRAKDRANIEGGYQDRLQEGLGRLEGLGSEDRKRINTLYDERNKQDRGQVEQDLISRGLGNTTIRNSMLGGTTNRLNRNRDLALGQLDSNLRNQLFDAYRGLSGDRLGALERQAESYSGADERLSGQGLQALERLNQSREGIMGQNLTNALLGLRSANQAILGADMGLTGQGLSAMERGQGQQLNIGSAGLNALERGQAQQLATTSGAGEQLYNFMERRTDAYPDIGQLIGLANAYGSSGGGLGGLLGAVSGYQDPYRQGGGGQGGAGGQAGGMGGMQGMAQVIQKLLEMLNQGRGGQGGGAGGQQAPVNDGRQEELERIARRQAEAAEATRRAREAYGTDNPVQNPSGPPMDSGPGDYWSPQPYDNQMVDPNRPITSEEEARRADRGMRQADLSAQPPGPPFYPFVGQADPTAQPPYAPNPAPLQNLLNPAVNAPGPDVPNWTMLPGSAGYRGAEGYPAPTGPWGFSWPGPTREEILGGPGWFNPGPVWQRPGRLPVPTLPAPPPGTGFGY